jgi:hypothetical protein
LATRLSIGKPFLDDTLDRTVATLGIVNSEPDAMRAAFIPKPVENAARLEDPKKVARHRDSGTIKEYDRCGYNPEYAASFLTTY